MLKVVYEINEQGFIIEHYVGEFKEGNLITDFGDKTMVLTVLPKPLIYIKPRWNGTKWIEGATQEEIEESTKVEPSPPTQTVILEQRLADLELMLAEILFN